MRQATNSARWDEQDTIMTSLENIFNESNRAGLSSSLNKFFTAWQDLALRPEDAATRESLLSYADNLSDMFGSTMDGIKAIQKEMDVSIGQTVDRVNDISKAIADLNRQITSNTVDGVSNPNSLLDKRDQLVRELASLADVETIDNGKGNFRVQLSNGQPLVDGQNSYELKIMGPQAENRLSVNSPYKGSVQFDGADSHEYTVEIVNGGNAGDVPPPAVPRFPGRRQDLAARRRRQGAALRHYGQRRRRHDRPGAGQESENFLQRGGQFPRRRQIRHHAQGRPVLDRTHARPGKHHPADRL